MFHSNKKMISDSNYKRMTKYEKCEIERLISISQNQPLTLENVWMLMDLVWDELKCSNKVLNLERMTKFYRHPVWLLNGIFIEEDELSMQHRTAIANWIAARNLEIRNVLDYGGGFGTLGRIMAKKNNRLQIDIYEPNPNGYALLLSKPYDNIRFLDKIDGIPLYIYGREVES